jgi:hypothetical protein
MKIFVSFAGFCRKFFLRSNCDGAHRVRRSAAGRAGAGRGGVAREHSGQPAPRAAVPRVHAPRDGGRGAGLCRLSARQAGDVLGSQRRAAHGMVSGSEAVMVSHHHHFVQFLDMDAGNWTI